MTAPPVRVLIVEDDSEDVMLIREMLAEAKGGRFVAESCARISEALTLLESGDFDVILLDLNLPDSRGLDTISSVHERNPSVPLVVLTGQADPTLGVQAVQAGAQDYLVKGRVNADLLERSMEYARERQRIRLEARLSETRYRSLIELAPDITYRLDPDGRFVYVSRAVELLGYEPAKLAGQPVETLLHPEDAPRVRQRACERRTGARITRGLDVRLRPNPSGAVAASGAFLFATLSARGLWSVPDEQMATPAKRFIGTQGVIRDVTDRKRADEATAQHIATLTSMVEVTARLTSHTDVESLCRAGVELGRTRLGMERLGIWLADAESGFVCGTFGTDADGHTRDERQVRFHVGEDSPMSRVLAGKSDVEVRYMPLESGRGSGWLVLAPIPGRNRVAGILSADSLFTGRPFQGHAVQLLRLFAVAIGRLLQALRSEDARRETQAIFRTFSDTTAAVLFISQGTRFVYANPAAESFFGYSQQELHGMDFWEVVHPEYRELVKERGLARQRNEPAESQYEIKVCAKNGEERWMDFRADRIELEGRPAVLGVALDITARKKSEQALREYAERMETWRLTQHQLQMARQIQMDLLPKSPPLIPGYELWAATYPAEATGGDYFDFIRLGGDKLAMIIGDASGHGLGPALLAADASAYLRALALTDIEPSEILADANLLLSGDVGSSSFVALIFALLDPETRTLRYTNAGQASGYVLAADGSLKATLESTDLPLGVDLTSRFPTAGPFQLETGDTVCLISDGLQEARDENDRVLGIARVLQTLRANLGKSAREIVEALYAEAMALAANTSPADDITVMVLKVLAPHPKSAGRGARPAPPVPAAAQSKKRPPKEKKA
jgi:PAS domain S-box-containing protein